MQADLNGAVLKLTSAVWKVVQTIVIFNKEVDKDCYEDGAETVWRRLIQAVKTSDSKEGAGKKIVCSHLLVNS